MGVLSVMIVNKNVKDVSGLLEILFQSEFGIEADVLHPPVNLLPLVNVITVPFDTFLWVGHIYYLDILYTHTLGEYG